MCAQLRNHIYNSILLNIPEQGPRATRMYKRNIAVVVPSSTEQVPLTLHESVETALRIRPRHLDLTQTCRIIRDEFRPLYLAKKYVMVTHDTVHKYLETFAAEEVGNIGVAESPFEDPVIDVLPLLVPASLLRKIRFDYRAVVDGPALKHMSTFLQTVCTLSKKSDLFRTLVEAGMLKGVEIQEVKVLDINGFEIPCITLKLVHVKIGNDAKLMEAEQELELMELMFRHAEVSLQRDYGRDANKVHNCGKNKDGEDVQVYHAGAL